MLFIGSDHAGFDTKEYVKKLLDEMKIKYSDEGTYSKDPADYPFYAKEVTRNIKKPSDKGILICDTGIGMSIAANKQKGIRAALVSDVFGAKRSRSHNNANVLVLAAATTSKPMVKKILKAWFSTKFSNVKRHKRRVDALE